MPIVVKDFTWNQTETELFVRVKMFGVTANKLDVFITDSYIKLNCSPYFWELFLSRKIISERNHIKIENGNINLRLKKKDVGYWKEISVDFNTDKNSLVEKRREEIAEFEINTKEKDEKKLKKKQEQKRDLVLQQIKVEEDERKRIELEKEKEKWKAMKEVFKYKEEKPIAESRESKPSRKIPPVRRSFTIRVQFTPTERNVPARENTQTEPIDD